jgi:hypothetical protein
MKTKTIAGLTLIIVGVLIFTYQGISYTTREKAIDLGPLQVTAEETHTFPLPPVLGALSLLGGVVLIVLGNKRAA